MNKKDSKELYQEFSNMTEKEYNNLILNAKSEDEKNFYLLVENFFMEKETEKAILAEKY